jgi:hypothetical protein
MIKIKIKTRMNNRSQIGSTLTWFVGFLVIFFILGLFLAATTLFSLKKKIISGSDEIELEKHLSDAKEQRILFSVLNSNINFSDKELKIKNILKNTDVYNLEALKKQELNEKIESKIKEILTDEFGETGCYFFEAKYSLDKTILKIDNLNQFYNLESSKNKLLEMSVVLVLIRDTNTYSERESEDSEKVIINFYGGKCL